MTSKYFIRSKCSNTVFTSTAGLELATASFIPLSFNVLKTSSIPSYFLFSYTPIGLYLSLYFLTHSSAVFSSREYLSMKCSLRGGPIKSSRSSGSGSSIPIEANAYCTHEVIPCFGSVSVPSRSNNTTSKRFFTIGLTSIGSENSKYFPSSAAAASAGLIGSLASTGTSIASASSSIWLSPYIFSIRPQSGHL